ncbi:MAG: S-layer homology domain-containing protein [Clostridiales bacterium]|nr:S-layer homology domain-containing protein [Clostridiales bacterium]
MTKRIIALLLALILTVGLLPTVALADDEVTATKMEPVIVEDSGDNTTFRKTISENDDGSYKVTLEAWATGKTIVEETKIPLDIVLVLDKSGSMEETFSTKSETIYRKIESSDFRYNEYYWNWSADNIGLWYKVGEKYYKVNVDRSYDARKVHFVYTYTYQDSNGQMQTIGTSTRRYRDPGYDFYRKEVVNSTTTKMDALKEAATSFATTVQRKAAEDKLEHRIAVVSYSTDAYIATGSNAESALVEVNKGTGLETVKNAINNLEADGGTQIDLGIKKANEIFAANEIEEGKRARVVIAFTDGTPGLYGYWAADGWHGSNNFNTHETANAAIQAAYSSINTYKASVYTIGIFDGADNATLPNYTKDAEVKWNYTTRKWEYVDRDVAAQAVANSNRFMHLVSSNYPTAKSMEDAGKINSELGENSFYLAASSAGELSEVFDAIGNTISTVTTTLNDKATIVDKVPSNFTISANAENISLKVANCIGENNEALTFATPEAAPEAVKAKRQGNTVLVNGFNFSDKWCGKENDAYRGQKLIVSFDITHNNYGGTQPTNDGACIKDARGESFIDVDNPSIPVKITEPRITGVTRSKVYDGTGFDVLSTIAEDIDALADGEKNAYVDIVVTVTSGSNTYTYTIKKGDKSGSWDKTGLTTDKDVKIENGAVSSYTYDLSITFKDATANGAADAIEKTTATYTITKRPVTLTSESATQEYNGNALTRPTVSVTGAGAERFQQEVENLTANGTVTGTADMIEAQSVTNNISYTWKDGFSASNYTITTNPGTLTITPVSQLKITFKTETGGKIDGGTEPIEKTVQRNDSFPAVPTPTPNTSYYFDGWYKGNTKVTSFPEKVTENATYTAKWAQYTPLDLDLTGKFQKHLTSNTATLPTGANSFELKITNKSDNSVLTGEATVTLDSSNKGTESFTFKDATGTAVTKLTFASTGTYAYTVQETNGNVAGMSYDTTEYTLTIVVTGDNGALTVSSAKLTKKGESDADVVVVDFTDAVYNSYTIENTYTKPAYTVAKSVITEEKDNGTGYALNYPVNGKVIVDADTDAIRLGYVIKITGNAGASFTLEEDADGKFIATSASEVTVITADKKLSITLSADHNDGNPILIYAVKDISRDTMTKAFPATVKNVVTEEDDTTHESGETTIEERGTLTVDFGALVRKHLTVTGDKSFNGATFTVNFTEGMFIKKEKENEPKIASIEVYAADAGVNERGLPDLTASVTYGADERDAGYKPFDGADLTIRVEGTYFYLVSEVIPDGATGYDTNEYIIGISVENDGDHLKVAGVGYSKYIENSQEDPEITWNEGPTFYNTIDTGKDDYYPIIIPTIINKDTGMLNKTDHFAYVIGYPDGTVHPNGQITRAEVATIFFRLLRDEVRDGAFTTSNSYSDVAYGKWYNNPISTMSALGIITGYPDGTFKPNKPITRAEFAAIAARFDETQSGKSATFSDVIGHWAAKEIGIAYYNDWIKGYPDGTFKPDQNITRAEAMTLINRVLERKPESPADLLTNMNKWTDNMDTSKWYYLDVQEATNSHGYTRKTFNYELWRQMLPDPDWSRYER